MFRCFSGAIYINRNNDPLASVTVSAEMNGLPLYFDRALHLAPNAAVFAAARDAPVAKYAVA